MTLLYSFHFENEIGSVTVFFVDDSYDISNAEQLAQIEHQSRRKWALSMIKFMQESSLSLEKSFDLEQIEKCSFGQRLKLEKWINPTVVLLQTDNQFSLYVYRYYRFILNFSN